MALLSHPNGWRRDTAQRLLVERGDATVAPMLARLAREADEPRTRLHALWTLDGLDAITVAHVETALTDRSPHVRAAGVRIAERWLDAPLTRASRQRSRRRPGMPTHGCACRQPPHSGR